MRSRSRLAIRIGVLIALIAAAFGVAVPATQAQAFAANYTYLCDHEPWSNSNALELVLTTGADNLGGDNHLTVTIVPRYHAPVTVTNVNQGQEWPNYSVRVVHICLTTFGITAAEISGVRLATTTQDGTFADNWNLNALQLNYLSWDWLRGSQTQSLYNRFGNPLVRLTASARTFDARVNPVFDGGFELQSSTTVGSPWWTEGPDFKGIDLDRGTAQTGANNGSVWSTGNHWNAILQDVPVTPNTDYVLTGWVRTTPNINIGYFGARLSGVWPPPGEAHFGYTGTGYQQVTARFNSTNHTTVTVYCGLWGTWSSAVDALRIDNITLNTA